MNFELRAPQSEYRELKRQWEDIWEHGRKDAKTGAVSSLPIDLAKERFLNRPLRPDGDGSRPSCLKIQVYFTDSSSGSVATEKRR